MSGHSKWATTKHRKGAKDSARAKVFAKLIRQVEVAAREGGGAIFRISLPSESRVASA